MADIAQPAIPSTPPLGAANLVTPAIANPASSGAGAASAVIPAAASATWDTADTASITAGKLEHILDGQRLGGSDDADTWLLTLAICVPIAASVGVIIAYSIDNDAFRAFFIGAAVDVAMLILLVSIYKLGKFNTAQHASVDTYNKLCQRMDRVLRIDVPADPDDKVRQAQHHAAESVRAGGEAFLSARQKQGIHWVLGKGYIDLSGVVHRAEEALLLYEPLEELLDDALADRARLEGSQIPARDDLLNRSRHALGILSPTSVQYLPPLTLRVPDAGNGAADPGHGGQQLDPGVEARAILRDVRYQVNTFREERRRNLIQVRDDLISTLFLTGLATVLLLALLVIGRPSESTLLGGAVLYTIGMIVGLFVHLSAAPNPGKLQEDYGLSTVALFQIAALSGIAAVLGAYVGVTFPAVVDVNKVTQAGLGAIPSPAQVYNLANYPVTIIFALIFAITPRLLIQRLAAGVAQTQSELKTSNAGN